MGLLPGERLVGKLVGKLVGILIPEELLKFANDGGQPIVELTMFQAIGLIEAICKAISVAHYG